MSVFNKYWMLCIIFVMASGRVFAQPCEIKVGWEDWPPYIYKDNGKFAGIDVEILEAVMGELKCKIIWKEMVWKRTLSQLEKGRIQVGIQASKTSDREVWGYFPDTAYRKEIMSVFVRKEDVRQFSFQHLKELAENKKFTLGATLGYFYGDEFQSLVDAKAFQNKIQYVNVESKNYAKLMDKKQIISGFVADRFATIDALKKQRLNELISVLPTNVNLDNVYFLFSKKSVDFSFVKKFDAVQKKLKVKKIPQILSGYEL